MSKDFRLANWFIFYVATLLFFAVGAITTLGTDWYTTLVFPTWAPAVFFVAVIWCVLFIMEALSAQAFWDASVARGTSASAISLYASNVLLVLLWNYLFFGLHKLNLAFVAALLVALSLFMLIISVQKTSKRAALLLLPYIVWMLFALCLTYTIWTLNS